MYQMKFYRNTETHAHINKQKHKSKKHTWQSMNKKADEQAKDLIFHQRRFNNLPHEFTITVLHSINTQSINTQ